MTLSEQGHSQQQALPKRPNQRPKNKAARHAYVSRKKPGFDRLPYHILKAVSAEVDRWNNALFAHARAKVQRAGSVCCEEIADGDSWRVVPVCPLYAWCRSETRKGYDPACAWGDDDMADALRRVRR